MVKRYEDIDAISNELHAVLIFLLLKDHALNYAEKMVICVDYNYKKVSHALDLLLGGNQDLLNKFESLPEYRMRTNNLKLKSYADGFVRCACKHAKRANNVHRRNPIFNNFNFVRLKDVIYCLDFVLAGVKLVEIDKTYTLKQENLNTSLLTIYTKTGNP